jgi:hypothetical protein
MPKEMAAPALIQQPTIGRIVLYRLHEHDVRQIQRQRVNNRGFSGGTVEEGEIFPAIVVKVWESSPTGSVNLQVLLNGNDTYWIPDAPASVPDHVGIEPGFWAWPPRL